jgi:hypothetical protein
MNHPATRRPVAHAHYHTKNENGPANLADQAASGPLSHYQGMWDAAHSPIIAQNGGKMKDAEIWQAALGELQLQMTRETFNTWLKPTQADALNDGTLTIRVGDKFVKEWLDNRLRPTIERTVTSIVGRPTTVEFVIGLIQAQQQAPSDQVVSYEPSVSVELVEYDPTKRGYVQTSNYAIRFWMPYLGLGPFSLWLALRSFAYDASKVTWPSIATLSGIVSGGDRQRLIGRSKRGQWTPGYLDQLEQERIVWYKRTGNNYKFRVLNSLPLLAPDQVKQLPTNIQKAHERFVRHCEIDYEEWVQLPLPTLAQTMPETEDEQG